MTTSDASSGEPRPTSDPIPNGEPPPSNPPPSSPPPPSEPSTVYEPVASTAPAPLAPRIEPSVGAAYSYAWSLLFKDFVPLLIIGIVVGSTFKGVITGLAIGFFARKVDSLALGIVFGLAVGLFLSYLVAAMPNPDLSHPYYLEIMIPGGIVGMIVGLATQKFKSKTATPRVPIS